jgi:hypothetical protein
MCFVIFVYISPSTFHPTLLTRSLLNLLFNLAGSEICCYRWCCWTFTENCADTNGIIEGFIRSKVIENEIDGLFTFCHLFSMLLLFPGCLQVE